MAVGNVKKLKDNETLRQIDKTGKGMIGEFKEFALRGNVVDLAVGVIIGGAFQTIVNSIVKDVIMPLISWAIGKVDYSNMFIALGKIPADADPAKLQNLAYVRDTLGLPVFAYGSFITVLINFLIMAFIIFLLVKGINTLRNLHSKPEEAEEPATKICEYCKSEIPRDAVRCPHCTSLLDEKDT